MGALWLVCDVSGSMLEAGKRLVVRSLVREVEQYFRLGYAGKTDIKLVAWNQDAKVLPWSPGDEVPAGLLECRDSADGDALVQLLADQIDAKFMVFTDGFWSNESRGAIKRWKDEHGQSALRIVKVGADANPKLKGPEVFEAEEFFAALDGWLGT
jgi:hypothetical protein